jgi:hypothetical protein
MTIRKEPIYLSTQVWRALWLLSKATPSKNDGMSINTATPDEMADLMLRDSIARNYPQLFEHQKKLDKLDKELIESLQK